MPKRHHCANRWKLCNFACLLFEHESEVLKEFEGMCCIQTTAAHARSNNRDVPEPHLTLSILQQSTKAELLPQNSLNIIPIERQHCHRILSQFMILTTLTVVCSKRSSELKKKAYTVASIFRTNEKICRFTIKCLKLEGLFDYSGHS